VRAFSKPPRASWHGFPDVLIHAAESDVKQHPSYIAAKSGDANAAIRLVSDTLNPAQVDALAAMFPGAAPTLTSAHAYEQQGVNAIPEAFADAMGQLLGWPVDSEIVQSNIVAHTGAGGFERLARQAAFDGAVLAGTAYVLVDDFVGMGGTLANLRGYIHASGGKVLAAVALTGKPWSAKLSPDSGQLEALRERHGQIAEAWWECRFGHTFDALTQSEARYLARTEDFGRIRDRIAAAE
jgi:hypothetical protein